MSTTQSPVVLSGSDSGVHKLMLLPRSWSVHTDTPLVLCAGWTRAT